MLPASNIFHAAVEDMKICSFPSWYPSFEKIAIRGVCLPIPNDVVEYLRDEIVILPKECYAYENNRSDSRIEFSTDAVGSEPESYDSEDEEILQPEFPEFSQLISKTIEEFKGQAAFLKTKWHSPKDSFWITAGQTLRVKDMTDVYQLLKASSIVKQDLNYMGLPEYYQKLIDSKEFNLSCAKTTDDHFLVLKEWHDIHPGSEFRCFVRQRNLIAISPRDWPAYHQHIVQQRHEICNDIVSVFKEIIKEKFPLDNFVFDVVRLMKDQVMLVDFAPFNSKTTESYAFDWCELVDDSNFCEEDHPEFRYLPNDCGIQPAKRNNYGVPFDIVNMFRHTNCEEGTSDVTVLLLDQLKNELETAG